MTNGMFAIVDEIYYQRLSLFTWEAKQWHRSWYARTIIITNGKKKHISMHRLVAQTPPNLVCHHKNFISLDNRKENLENMTKKKHNQLHARNNLKIIFGKNNGGFAQEKRKRLYNNNNTTMD